ncbi:MAG: SHOCT domain-containing protein [Solirubrobacteraceae bacterium]
MAPKTALEVFLAMLGLGWEHGVATIVARQTTAKSMYHLQAATGPYHTTYDYVADVQPDSGAPVFRATFTELFAGDYEHRPDVGEQARVKFHAKSEKVEFDRRALEKQAKASTDAGHDRFKAIANAAPGSSDGASARSKPPSAPGAHEDPEKVLKREATEAMIGSSAKAPSFKEIMAARGIRGAEESIRARVTAESADADKESIEHRLAKLQHLRDDGALTAEEYAAQRQRILDSV